MVQAIDWAPRENILHSFELLARYVMPHFQGSTLSTAASNYWAYERRDVLGAGRVAAIERARADYAGRTG
jgi:limonene 1,2-monooxygenase